VSTGEGKSLIVVTLNILKVLCSEVVDVITSSAVLAVRDALEYKSIYSEFGISVAHNGTESTDDLAAVYRANVVYGDVSAFQRDFLLDRFYGRNIRGSRSFQTVVVDEVDSMLLDKGNNVLYLSHQPPGLDALEPVLVFIWQSVITSLAEQASLNPLEIQQKLLANLYPCTTPKELNSLVVQEKDKSAHLWDWLISSGIINSKGRLKPNLRLDSCFNRLPSSQYNQSEKSRLEHLFLSKQERTRPFKVPEYLKEFVQLHAFQWILNAYRATEMVEGREYIVDVDHTMRKLDREPKILILDLDTGMDQTNSQWSEGLHQFLQLKHGCRLSLLSLKAVFISNITFFCKYDTVLGLTGTVGSATERNFLRDTYNLSFLTVPLAMPSQFVEEEPFICPSVDKWKKAIKFRAEELAITKKRAVLVICADVKSAEEIYNYLIFKSSDLADQTLNPGNVELYRRNYETFQATQPGHKLSGGKIIVATNLAGRGTDIKLSDELAKAGGLHVILSYLPDNVRVEQQAFGRSARGGIKGSGQLVFLDPFPTHGESTASSLIAIDLKMHRDEEELRRISAIKSHYEDSLKEEELYFEKFRKEYEEMKVVLETAFSRKSPDHKNEKSSTLGNAFYFVKNYWAGRPTSEKKEEEEEKLNEIKELVLYSFLDGWAFWLDAAGINNNNTNVNTSHNIKTSREKQDSLREFLQKYSSIATVYRSPEFWDAFSSVIPGAGITTIASTAAIAIASKEIRGWIKSTKVEAAALSTLFEPALIIKAAKCYLQRKDSDSAIKYLNKVIDSEAEHCVAARYYKAATILQKSHLKTHTDRTLFFANIRGAEEALQAEIGLQSSLASTVEHCYRAISAEKRSFVQTKGYANQKESSIVILSTLLQSIHNMVGQSDLTPKTFEGTHGDPEIAEALFSHLIDLKVILESRFINEIPPTAVVEKVAKEFALRTHELSTYLQQFKDCIVNEDTCSRWEQAVGLPSRNEFWDQLAKSGAFHQTKDLLFIRKKTGTNNPTNTVQNISAQTNSPIGSNANLLVPEKGYILMALYDEDLSNIHEIRLQPSEKELNEDPELLALRMEDRLVFQRMASVSFETLQKSEPLSSYTLLDKKAFTRIEGISDEGSSEVWDILKAAGLIDNKGMLSKNPYSPENALDFGLKYRVYETDILAIICKECLYRFELLQLMDSFEKNVKEGKDFLLVPSLQINPHKILIATLLEAKIIRGMSIDEEFFNESGFKEFFKGAFNKPIQWGEWVGKKLNLVDNPTPTVSHGEIQNQMTKYMGSRVTVTPVLAQEAFDQMVSAGWIDLNGIVLLKDANIKPLGGLNGIKPYEKHLRGFVRFRRDSVLNTEFLPSALQKAHSMIGGVKTATSPDAFLYDLEDQFGDGESYQHRHEVHTFALNGFDHIVSVEEEQYTWRMIFSTLAVILIGVAQIALGGFLQFITFGAGTFLAAGLISEGLSDIMYGIQAARSGHFSWKDWADHKWVSMATTTAMMGIGAVIAKGVKFSKFGFKLGGPEWATKSGSALKEAVKDGLKKINTFKLVAKSIGKKVVQGFAFGLSAVCVHDLCNSTLRSLCANVGSTIFANVDKAIDDYKIKDVLFKLYEVVDGDTSIATKIVNEAQSSVLSSSHWSTGLTTALTNIASTLISGVKAAVEKIFCAGQGDSELQFLLTAIKQLGKLHSVVHTLEELTKNATDYMRQFRDKLHDQVEKRRVSKSTGPAEIDFQKQKEFLDSVVRSQKALLRQRIGDQVQRTIVEPLLNAASQKLITKIGRFLRDAYKQNSENNLKAEYRKRKAEHEAELEKLGEKYGEHEKELQKNATLAAQQAFHKDVLMFMCRTRNPDLVADIVGQGGPLGLESLQAIANTLGIRITIECDNKDIPEVIEPGGTADNASSPTTTIRLRLSPGGGGDSAGFFGHWTSATASNNSTNTLGEEPTTGNDGPNNSPPNNSMDCLLHALNEELRHHGYRGLTRCEIADAIRMDPQTRHSIQAGWNGTFTSIGAFGGAEPNRRRNHIQPVIPPVLDPKGDFAKPYFLPGDGEDPLIGARLTEGLEGQIQSREVGSSSIEEVSRNEKGQLEYVKWTASRICPLEGEPTKKNAKLAEEVRGKGSGKQCGHLKASRFGGLMERDNLVEQDPQVNQSWWKVYENAIAKWLTDGGNGAYARVQQRFIFDNTNTERHSGFFFLIEFRNERGPANSSNLASVLKGYSARISGSSAFGFMPNLPSSNNNRTHRRGPG
jgi:hypothetical protein